MPFVNLRNSDVDNGICYISTVMKKYSREIFKWEKSMLWFRIFLMSIHEWMVPWVWDILHSRIHGTKPKADQIFSHQEAWSLRTRETCGY